MVLAVGRTLHLSTTSHSIQVQHQEPPDCWRLLRLAPWLVTQTTHLSGGARDERKGVKHGLKESNE